LTGGAHWGERSGCPTLRRWGSRLRSKNAARPERPHSGATAQRDETGRAVPLDELQGTAELVDDRSLRLNAVQTDVAGLERYGRRRSVMRGQHRLKHGRPHRVLPACHSKRELRGKGSHAGGAGTLPLRPHQSQRRAVSAAPANVSRPSSAAAMRNPLPCATRPRASLNKHCAGRLDEHCRGGGAQLNPEGPQHADAEGEQSQLLRDPDNQSSCAGESQPENIPRRDRRDTGALRQNGPRSCARQPRR
jgi:hypothetical protein